MFRNVPNIKCHRLPLTNTRPLSGKSYPQQVSSYGSLVRICAVQGFQGGRYVMLVRSCAEQGSQGGRYVMRRLGKLCTAQPRTRLPYEDTIGAWYQLGVNDSI